MVDKKIKDQHDDNINPDCDGGLSDEDLDRIVQLLDILIEIDQENKE